MNDEIPAKLRPFTWHGIPLGPIRNNESYGDCIFCSRSDKFAVNSITGKWHCWKCGKEGNVWTFLREFHALCLEATKPNEYRDLATNRGYLDIQCLIEWGLARSITTGDWLIPGYNGSQSMTSLYRNMKQQDGSHRLIPTPTLGHHIHGMNFWDAKKPIVYICEGPWDGIALWEVLTQTKVSGSGMCPTASRENSLYAQANVIAVPGAEVFFEPWLALLEGKIVNLMYDSDHPRKHPKTGHISPGAGWHGMQRVVEMLDKSSHKPQEINCLTWGPEGFDPKHKSGFDVRDMITKG
jgi:hypothetical protein